MKNQTSGWRWREDEITLKKFYSLSQPDRDEYLALLKGLKPEDRSSGDEIILNMFNLIKPEVKNFFSF
jgi:hypothetical protein